MLLGIDLGTTNIKALVVTPQGKIIARGSMPVSLKHTPDGGVEQDIEEIWQATIEAIRMAGKDADLATVQAIGISSQGGAVQLRDRKGQCVGPVISWLDARGQPYDEALLKQVGEPWLVEHIGNGSGGVAVGQVLRLRDKNPSLIAKAPVIGFVGDEIVRRLCGRAAHDCSSLSISCLYNPAKQQADPDLLKRLDLKEDQLPDLLPARSSAGTLKPDIAKATGLRAGIPVSPAVHDQYAAAIGCGAIQPGDTMFGAGTAWVLVAVADHLVKPLNPLAWVCDHVLPERWGQLLSLYVGGSAFKWAMDMVNLGDAPPSAIDDALEAVPPGADGVRLWPFLDGYGGYLRLTSGRVLGLKLSHGRGHLLRATLEGLCFELARQFGWLKEAGCPVTRLIMCGGASRSRITPQVVADITGCPVICPSESEISAFGASMLARGIIEPQAAMETICRAMAGPAREIRPGPAAAAYTEMLRDYVAAVDAASRA